MSSEPVIIAAWPKNSRETLQVRLDTFKGQAIVDCCAWYLGRDDVLRPGKSGLTIATKRLLQLAVALMKAMSMAMESKMLPGDSHKNE